MQALMQRMSMQAVPTLSEISASEFLATIQKPSADPYWKLKAQGNCQDIMFLANYDKIPVLVHDMQYFANTAGYSGAEIGVYLQPIVQGVNCHCEFNLFYNPEDAAMTAMIKNLNKEATRKLMANGAFFSRPYAETTGMIMNRDAATVATLKKVKSIVDPDNILNPGKLCF
jgi:FAD/FMN-containing dehydrogenase